MLPVFKYQTTANQKLNRAFTIAELLVVIVIIGILATVSIVAYNNTRQRANSSVASTDLHNASNTIELAYAKTGIFPVTMPTDTKTSPGIVLQLATPANDSTYCINAYSTKDSSVRASWDSSKGGLQSAPCSGATIGSPVGGTVPTAPRNQNIMSDYSRWTFTGGATFNSITNELILTPSGTARSPIIRVDSPQTIAIGADMYAVNSSAYPTFTPQAGYHSGISYFASDGVTPVMNSGNYIANGCAKAFSNSTWLLADKRCTFSGGPNVVYVSVNLTGSNGGYASSDLILKNPILTVSN